MQTRTPRPHNFTSSQHKNLEFWLQPALQHPQIQQQKQQKVTSAVVNKSTMLKWDIDLNWQVKMVSGCPELKCQLPVLDLENLTQKH